MPKRRHGISKIEKQMYKKVIVSFGSKKFFSASCKLAAPCPNRDGREGGRGDEIFEV